MLLLASACKQDAEDDIGASPGSYASSCTEPAHHPPLAACIALGENTDAGLPPRSLPIHELTATVASVGEGLAAADCFGQQTSFGSEPATGTAADHTRWLRLLFDDGTPATIAVVGDGFEWPLHAGDAFSLNYEREGGGFSPTSGWLELRAEDGTLLVWVGAAGAVEDLQTPPELSLSQGAEVCRNHSQCIPDWAQYDLWLKLGDEVNSTPLGYGQHVTAGDFIVTHGGVDQQIGGATNCPDAYVAAASAAAWRAR